MEIKIKTNVGLPEMPRQVQVPPGTLKDLLLKVFGSLKFSHEIIDPKTGEMKFEGVFEVRLNNISCHSLEQGLATDLCDGDTVHVNLMVFGGG
jgi:hypothetical protein